MLGLLVTIVMLLLPYVPVVLWLRYYEGRAAFASTGLRFDRSALTGLGVGFGVAAVFVAGWIAVALILPVFLPTVATGETAKEYPGLILFMIDDPNPYAGGSGFAGLFEGLPATVVLLVLVTIAAVAYGARRYRGARTPAVTGASGSGAADNNRI